MSDQFKDSAREMRRFYRAINRAFTGFETLEETEGGYSFTYAGTDTWRATMEGFRSDFQRRFPAFEVTLDELPGGSLRLVLTGGEGGREFVEGMIAAAQAGTLVLPSPVRESLVRTWRRATCALRMDPSFLILGAPRCGTTALHAYLSEHPRVLAALGKELAYFDIFYGRGKHYYRALFPLRSRQSGDGSGRTAITGEATPTYLAHPAAPERVRADLPDVKLIVMLRSPVERAFSQYHWGVRNGVEDQTFEVALDLEEQRLAGEAERMRTDVNHFSSAWVYHSYASTGRYAEHLERWFAVFPREQIMVVSMEELAVDPGGQFRRVVEFLGLPAFEPAGFPKLNAFPYPDLDAGTRRRLEQEFQAHDDRLRELLGTALGWDGSSASPGSEIGR